MAIISPLRFMFQPPCGGPDPHFGNLWLTTCYAHFLFSLHPHTVGGYHATKMENHSSAWTQSSVHRHGELTCRTYMVMQAFLFLNDVAFLVPSACFSCSDIYLSDWSYTFFWPTFLCYKSGDDLQCSVGVRLLIKSLLVLHNVWRYQEAELFITVFNWPHLMLG